MFIAIAKAVSELACVIGSEVIVSGIAKNALNGNTNRVLKACAQVATACTAGVLGVAASKYADETIDEIAGAIEALRTRTGKETADGAA